MKEKEILCRLPKVREAKLDLYSPIVQSAVSMLCEGVDVFKVLDEILIYFVDRSEKDYQFIQGMIKNGRPPNIVIQFSKERFDEIKKQLETTKP